MPTPLAPTTPPPADPLPEFTRLSACPVCASRRRTLAEVAGTLVGRCLDCGTELPLPLATERQRSIALVGHRFRPGVGDGEGGD